MISLIAIRIAKLAKQKKKFKYITMNEATKLELIGPPNELAVQAHDSPDERYLGYQIITDNSFDYGEYMFT